MTFSTIPEIFWHNVEKYRDQPCLNFKSAEGWTTYSYGEVATRVEETVRGLAALNITARDKVSILSDNNPKWAIADYAILSLSAISVPVYPTLIPKQIKYILQDGDVKAIFAENRIQVDKLLQIYDDLDMLIYIVVMNGEEAYEQDYIISWDDLILRGRESQEKETFRIEDQWKDLTAGDLLTIIYTSGTTGEPKGVMLTHGNLTSNVEGGLQRIKVGPGDRFLSFLPLSHSFERMAGHFLPFTAGCAVYYAESIETVPENMVEVSPTVMTSVPRLYEKMYMRVNETVEQSSALRKRIFHWAFEIGAKYVAQKKQNAVSSLTKIRYALAHRLVFTKLHKRVGGELRFFVSGGAPLSADIARFFERAGIIILEGYGLTETSPVIAVNPLDNYKIGTVGPPIYNVEVTVANDGEILTRGPHIMKGYYKQEEATREAIDADGWLHTGDIGMLDEDNYLSVTDRKKNLIVTSGGKNVAPQPIEGALGNSPYIEQILLLGDKRNFISALIVPNFEHLKDWANKNGLYYGYQYDHIQVAEVNELFRQEIEVRTQDFARYEQVKQFRLIPKEFSIGNGELTPTLKIKRRVVEDEYHDLIESMYQES